MSAPSPTRSHTTSSTRLDSDDNAGLTTGTTVTNSTEVPYTPGHRDAPVSRYDDETAMNSSPPILNRGEPGDSLLNDRQVAEDVQEPNWDDEVGSDSPTPSASEPYHDHISALGLLESGGHRQQESDMDFGERDHVNSSQEEEDDSGQSRT